MQGNDHSIENQTSSSDGHTTTNGATCAEICAKPATKHQTSAKHAKEDKKSGISSTNNKKKENDGKNELYRANRITQSNDMDETIRTTNTSGRPARLPWSLIIEKRYILNKQQKRGERWKKWAVSRQPYYSVEWYGRNDTHHEYQRTTGPSTLIIASSILQKIDKRSLRRDVEVVMMRGAETSDVRQKIRDMDLSGSKNVILQVGGNDASNKRDPEAVEHYFVETIKHQGKITKCQSIYLWCLLESWWRCEICQRYHSSCLFYIWSYAHTHNGKHSILLLPGTWSHLWFAGVRECPPGALLLVSQ